MTEKPRDDRAAIDKAISILLAFGDQAHVGLGVSELARRSGLSKSTTFRVLGMLERNRAVERAGSAYRLGELLHELGSRVYAPTFELVRSALAPHLVALHEATHLTVELAVLHGSDVVYLTRLTGSTRDGNQPRSPGRAPAHCTSVGKILLAFDADALEETLNRPLDAWTAHTITDPMVLRSELSTARRTGVALDSGESNSATRSIAAAVFDSHRRPVAAMSIVGGTAFAPTAVEPVLRAACSAASRTLGPVSQFSAA